MEQRINQLFQHYVETTMEVGELLSANIALVAQRMANALLNEGKILVAANGCCAALGNLFVTSLLSQLRYERPSLPAMGLQADSSVITAISEQHGTREVYAKQIRALGRSGDILLIITTETTAKNIEFAVQAAYDKGINIIALCSDTNTSVENLLGVEDLSLKVPQRSSPTAYQAHLQILLTLTDLIDFQLFGVGDNL